MKTIPFEALLEVAPNKDGQELIRRHFAALRWLPRELTESRPRDQALRSRKGLLRARVIACLACAERLEQQGCRVTPFDAEAFAFKAEALVREVLAYLDDADLEI